MKQFSAVVNSGFVKYMNSLLSHKGFRRYFANTSWLFAEKLLRLLAGFFVGVWVARYLGPEQYGLLSYAQAFVGLFTAFANLGLDGILVRELVKHPEKEGELLGTAFGLKLIGAFLTVLLVAVAVNFTDSEPLTKLLVLIVSTSVIFQSFNVIDFYFQAKVQAKYSALANMIALFLSSLFKIYLILSNAPLIYFALAVVFDAVVLALGYVWWFVKVRGLLKELKFTGFIAKSLLKDSWPLILSGISVMIYMRIDQVMIKEMLGAEAVGQYSVAVKLCEVWYFIPIVISSSLFPAIINAKKVSEEIYYKRLQKLYSLMIWLAIGIALPMTLVGDWFINSLYGPDFAEASSVLKIYIWAGIFVFLGVATSKWLLSENLTNISFYRTIVGAVLNVILNLIFINKFFIIGAAIATLISYFVATFFIALIPKTQKHVLLLISSFNPMKLRTQ